MPITIPLQLPARKILEEENIFVMDNLRAASQDIRPLSIVILNLMPEKEKTETQLLRLLGNTPIQINITLLRTASYQSKNTRSEHLNTFYQTFEEIKGKRFDGLIITGAPVEHLEFEEVEYWEELKEIMEWSKQNVQSTLHICWGAQAALYFHYGIRKKALPSKCFGVFSHELLEKNEKIVRGFDDIYFAPQSRHTDLEEEDIQNCKDISIVSLSVESGVCLLVSKDQRQVFLTGHPEYDRYTLHDEYTRDINKGADIELPKHYYPDNNPNKEPIQNWKSHANLLFSNWLNYYVYQETPFQWE